jgi:competence ComEA-like helix-hairpin-helix protein
VGLYTQQQLVLLLLLLGAAAAGLGVVHWRAAHPETVERLERLDRDVGGDQATATDGAAAGGIAEPRSRPPVPSRSKLPPPSADAPVPPLDLNRATLADLTGLPGVGPVLARRILEARDGAGRFATVDDLAAVRGLGRVKLERLRPFVGIAE